MFHLRAPAKINWYLKVLNKRKDGFHNIESLMQKISLFDEMTFQHSDTVDLLINPPMNISISDNLIYRTVLKLREKLNIQKGVSIKVKKNVPIGAGLGGGSSDSAYTLIGLNKLWGLGLSKEDLTGLAIEIGSDVPFFLSSFLASVKGKGEVIEELDDCQSYNIVIVKPKMSISTAWAYGLLNRGEDTSYQSDLNEFIKAFLNGDFNTMSKLGINDFENPIFRHYPELSQIKGALIKSGSQYSLMSGSGSCIFGLFETKQEASYVANYLKGLWDDLYIEVAESICRWRDLNSHVLADSGF